MSIDLRSDTVTKPTATMREAMASAVVDDDVIDSDPTVARLQQRTAELLGKEAAIFMPSGTMTNQVAVRCHCRPGDEFLCEAGCHIFNYEQGAFAQLSGLVAHTVAGDAYGELHVEQLKDKVRGGNEHLLTTRLVCLEITHNRGSGSVPNYDGVIDICDWAHNEDLKTHLDGARLFNAAVASGRSAAKWCEPFDTVSVCFSKGLGAPVGSALAGDAETIALARRHRKLFGGGMRQAGIIAAGALYALEHHVDRLADDHRHAQMLADAISHVPGLALEPARVDTNIVIFRVDDALGTAEEFIAKGEAAGVRLLPFSRHHVRAVTHLDVCEADIHQAAELIATIAQG